MVSARQRAFMAAAGRFFRLVSGPGGHPGMAAPCLQGGPRPSGRGVQSLRPVRPGGIRPEGLGAHQVRHQGRLHRLRGGASGPGHSGVRRRGVQPPHGRGQDRAGDGGAGGPGGPDPGDRPGPGNRRLDEIHFPRPQEALFRLSMGSPALYRHRLGRAHQDQRRIPGGGQAMGHGGGPGTTIT